MQQRISLLAADQGGCNEQGNQEAGSPAEEPAVPGTAEPLFDTSGTVAKEDTARRLLLDDESSNYG